MTTNDKGNIGLAKLICDMTIKGFQVFLPLTDTSLIDIIISDKLYNIKKLQVKYISLNSHGSIFISKETVVNRKRILNNFNNLDGFAIYCPNNDKLYYVNINEMGEKSFTINVNGKMSSRGISNNADKYEHISRLFV